MKLAKRLLVLVAALAMVFSLTACGGSKFPQEYSITEKRGEGDQVATLTLEEDGTYKFVSYVTESNGSGKTIMNVEMTGTYTLNDNIVTFDTAEGSGYYFAGASQTDFTFTKDEPGMFQNAYNGNSFEYVLDGDTFYPNAQ